MKGDPGTVTRLPSRYLASPDLYGHEEREPEQSINFVTAHDGFTLNDLVTYNEKHNHANGEGNQDGDNNNLSWNCGVEGPSDDPKIEHLRNRQVKNFLTFNLLALGTPMLLMGDEARRTQQGNNNAYCQDNEISWFDWHLLEKHADVHRFVQELIQIRNNLDVHNNNHDLTLVQFLQEAKIRWHGIKLNKPDWGRDSHSLALTVQSLTGHCNMHFMLNAYWEALTFELPPPPGLPGDHWRRVIDTFRQPPDDIIRPANAPLVKRDRYQVQSRTVVLLLAEGPAA
jgi:glycogen operon protein